MQKTVSPKHFLSTLRERTHRSKGGLHFGSYGRLYSDWKTVLVVYTLLLLIIVGISGYLFYRIGHHQVPDVEAEVPEVRVRTFDQEDLTKQIEILRDKRNIFTDKLANPVAPQI